jgi:invasion protein IalB
MQTQVAGAPPSVQAAGTGSGDITPSTFTGDSSAWVKLCEGDGSYRMCTMHHARYDAGTGQQLMYVNLTDYEGAWTGNFAVSTSHDSAQLSGIDVAVYAPGPWVEVAQNGSTTASVLFSLHLTISHCSFGCFGSDRASKELVAALKKGGGLVVRSTSPSGLPIVFMVPLASFADVMARPAFDSNIYSQKRDELLASLRQGVAQVPRGEPPPVVPVLPEPPPSPNGGASEPELSQPAEKPGWFSWLWGSKKPAAEPPPPAPSVTATPPAAPPGAMPSERVTEVPTGAGTSLFYLPPEEKTAMINTCTQGQVASGEPLEVASHLCTCVTNKVLARISPEEGQGWLDAGRAGRLPPEPVLKKIWAAQEECPLN